ncbi:hypothetical protein [Leptospira kirschneri]|uniref:hypothetical protein n=1 Tax=Leptospira kirschneri TaxID=29507 RepID=UPI00046C7290|nr:hypothetical protein [Leptospira kirschneri]
MEKVDFIENYNNITNNPIRFVITQMKRILFILHISILLLSCVSRLGRPELLGTIVDYDKNPVEGCAIGKTLTDKNGKFILPEIRYYEFFFQLEAPPLYISEIIRKEGFYIKEIYSFNPRGGGEGEGSKWDLGDIYLKKMNASININKLLISTWKVSTNKKIDTLYFVKSDTVCNTRDCENFYSKYLQYTDNYFRPNSLPEGILKKFITINFSSDGFFKAEKIVKYWNKNGSHDSKSSDTLNTIGKWLIDKELKIQLQSDFEELNGNFSLSELEYEFLELNRKQ